MFLSTSKTRKQMFRLLGVMRNWQLKIKYFIFLHFWCFFENCNEFFVAQARFLVFRASIEEA